MDLLENSKMSLSKFNFVMIYIIHKILTLLKNHLNYFKDNIFKYFFKDYKIDFNLNNYFFFIIYSNGKFKVGKKCKKFF